MARTLVIILTKEWIRLIGLNSDTDSAPSFFGMSIILAVLINGRLVQRRLWKLFAASVRSAFIMS